MTEPTDDVLTRLKAIVDAPGVRPDAYPGVRMTILAAAVAEIERLRKRVDGLNPMIRAEAPKPERWEVRGILLKLGSQTFDADLDGFEPFAATDHQVWFRRRVPT